MFKHLKYIDDKSDKFWQIEVKENSHTITYGRNGASGQVKTKVFDTGEACLNDAEKLVSEKLRKGYSEDGTVSEAMPVKSKTTSAAADKETIARELKDLILETNFKGLVPFLEKYAKGNTEFLRKEIKALRYQRNTSDKRDLIAAVALGVFNLSDTRNWDELAEALMSRSNLAEVQKVLDWAKPAWIAEYLLQRYKGGERYFTYEHLRRLEDMGHVRFHPELYALFISTYHTGIDYICTNELAYTRDVPLLFEYETSLHNTQVNLSRHITFLWDVAFERLLAEGKIKKEFLLIHVLEVQTKNWHNYLKAFFRKLIVRVDPEREIVIRNQACFFPLLHSEQSAIVNFAIDTLKLYLGDNDFDLNEFLDWAGPVFMRNDLKGGIKSLLIQLDKAITQKPELKGKICPMVADVFMISDLQLQERAAGFLLKHGKDSEIGEKLAMYSSQILGTLANDLKKLTLSDTSQLTDPDGLSGEPAVEDGEGYQFNPVPVKKLEEKIVYPENWNDIFSHVGKVIKTENTVDIEILLQTWLCKKDLFPADYKQQLRPYIWELDRYRLERWHSFFSREFVPFMKNDDQVYSEERHYDSFTHTILTSSDIVILVQTRILDKIFLPLLSAPTHEPFWVDPLVLIERIIEYEKAGQAIDLTDFAVALNRMPRENVEEATQNLQEVKDENIRDLLNFALGNTTSIQKGKDPDWNGLWALVARTHYPEAVFSEFSEAFAEIPFMVEPFRPELQMKADYWGNYNSKLDAYEQTEYLGDVLDIAFPTRSNVPGTFIYGKDIYARDEKIARYIHNSDITFMYSLMPQNTEALALLLVMIFNKSGADDYNRTTVLLKHMLNSFYAFNPASGTYLATSIFNKGKEARALACEVLIRSIDENRLPVEDVGSKLAILIQRNYAPVNRMLNILESVKDLSHKHNDALFKLLESLLTEIKLTDTIPTNFKKVLEFYYDLKHKLSRPVSPAVEDSLNALAGLKALQSIINKIKK